MQKMLIALVLTASVIAACGSDTSEDVSAEESSSEQSSQASEEAVDEFDSATWCAALTDAIEDVETTFQEAQPESLGVEFLQASADDFQRLIDDLPADAPTAVADILDVSQGLQQLFADSAASEDPRATVEDGIGPLLEKSEAIQFDPAEDWVDETCGIERLGIQLRLTDDDRTSTG